MTKFWIEISSSLLALIIIHFISAAVAVWLWALIVVPTFGAPDLTYWQMYGLLWLIRIVAPTKIRSTVKED